MILLVDASAAVDLLVRSDRGEQVRQSLNATLDVSLVTVAHLDAEVLSALARLHRCDLLTETEVRDLSVRLGAVAMQRVPITQDLLRSAWTPARRRRRPRCAVRRLMDPDETSTDVDRIRWRRRTVRIAWAVFGVALTAGILVLPMILGRRLGLPRQHQS